MPTLTDDQIYAEWERACHEAVGSDRTAPHIFARAIERALSSAEHTGAEEIKRLADRMAELAVSEAHAINAACARVELVVALHTLASHFENSLYALRDDTEARKKAEGDIAHAMKIAAKHNQNGRGCHD